MRRATVPVGWLLALAALLAGCGNGIHGRGTGPSLPDLLVPLAGDQVPAMSGAFDLDRYLHDFAAVPARERPKFLSAGFVEGWLLSTTDNSYGRRLYLMQFRDHAAAREVFNWYRGFVKEGMFTLDLPREHYGRVAPYQDALHHKGLYAQVLYPAGPFLVVVSVTVPGGTVPGIAKAEAGRVAAAESARLPS